MPQQTGDDTMLALACKDANPVKFPIGKLDFSADFCAEPLLQRDLLRMAQSISDQDMRSTPVIWNRTFELT
jgi:hypothetical protein